MSINSYGLLKGKAIDSKQGMGSSPHYQVLVSDDERLHRIAINVKSQMQPSALLYFLDENFEHPLINEIEGLPLGFTPLKSKNGGIALDFIRGNLFKPSAMKPLSHDVAGLDNDLNELIHKYIHKAIAMENSSIYAFGEKWGSETKRDRYFGFKPGSGVHDIHMNQGNDKRWQKDDGLYQDGGIIIHFPDEKRWVGIFLAFQSQCFHTDDIHGHKIDAACQTEQKRVLTETTEQKDGIRIIAAMVNPLKNERGRESITLINLSDTTINIEQWSLADSRKRRETLHGTVEAGETRKIILSGKSTRLINKGDIITLLNEEGIKVDGVSYTKKDASKEGWSILFR